MDEPRHLAESPRSSTPVEGHPKHLLIYGVWFDSEAPQWA